MEITGSVLDNISAATELKFAGGKIGDIISAVIPIIFYFAGVVLLLFLIAGGFKLMTSGGDPKKIQEGKTTLTNAAIGFAVVFVAYWIARILGTVLKIQTPWPF